jgi:hypothetical protein
LLPSCRCQSLPLSELDASECHGTVRSSGAIRSRRI